MVDYCNLESLIGCPEEVDGFFSCEANNLMTLEGFPKYIGAGILVRSNPGKFTYNDVLKAYRVELLVIKKFILRIALFMNL